jgi:hypothetical protein
VLVYYTNEISYFFIICSFIPICTLNSPLKHIPKTRIVFCVILVFRREVAENCALLGYYAASSGNFLSTFRDNLSFPTSGFKNPTGFLDSLTLRMGPIDFPETSVINYHYTLPNNPEDCRSWIVFFYDCMLLHTYPYKWGETVLILKPKLCLLRLFMSKVFFMIWQS